MKILAYLLFTTLIVVSNKKKLLDKQYFEIKRKRVWL